MPPIPILVGAAIIDSINPCAFGVLIFLLAYLTKAVNPERSRGTKKAKILLHGLTYIFAVFLTYLAAGLLLMPLIGSLGRTSVITYGIIGLIIILFGLLEIKDFFWYGRGPSLALLPGASKRIKMYVGKITGSVFSAFFLGVFVALVELPCTGAVYLAILSLMALSGTNALTVSWLVIYNLIFVLPLVVILFAFYQGINAEALEKWRKKHRHLMRLAIGLLLLGMGFWMLKTAFL